MALQYLDWVQHNDPLLNCSDGSQIILQTALNGVEKRVGRFIVDGYAMVNDQAHFWEFNGCQFHDCICLGLEEECDREKVSHLENVGVLHIMRMCTWNKLRKTTLSTFIPSNLSLRETVSETEILDAVKNGSFFGFVNLSLEIPADIASKFDWLNISYLFTRTKGSSGKERLMFCEKVQNTLIFRYVIKRLLVTINHVLALFYNII